MAENVHSPIYQGGKNMRKIVPYLLTVILVFQTLCVFPMGAYATGQNSVNVTADSRTGEVTVSGTADTSSDVTVNVVYPDKQNILLTPRNIKEVLAYTGVAHTNGSGAYSLSFRLPEGAPYGTYYVKTACNDVLGEESFNYSEPGSPEITDFSNYILNTDIASFGITKNSMRFWNRNMTGDYVVKLTYSPSATVDKDWGYVGFFAGGNAFMVLPKLGVVREVSYNNTPYDPESAANGSWVDCAAVRTASGASESFNYTKADSTLSISDWYSNDNQKTYDVYIAKTGGQILFGIRDSSEEDYEWMTTRYVSTLEENDFLIRTNEMAGNVYFTDLKIYTETRTVFEEEFNNPYLWTLSNMGVKNGALVGQTVNVCEATLKSDSASFGEAAGFEEYSFDFSHSDTQSGGWIQFVFRDDGTSAERLLIRGGRVCRYLPGESPSEIDIATGYSLSRDTVYHARIVAGGTHVQCVISDKETGEVIANGEYEASSFRKGNVGFRTYNRQASFYNFKVSAKTGDSLCFAKKPIYVREGEELSLAVINETGGAVSYSSADTSVVTVDANGTVTGVSAGSADITVSGGNASDVCRVTVVRAPMTLTAVQSELTLYPGDHISVSLAVDPADADCSDVVWSSSDENVATLFGSAGKTRTICAVSEGVALIRASYGTGDAEAVWTVRVMPEKSAGTFHASFGAGNTARAINDHVFGITANTAESNQYTYDLMDEMDFTILRNIIEEGQESQLPDNFAFANALGVPHMVSLPFYNQSVSELVAAVGQIAANLTQNETLYVEFGNELYTKAITASAFNTKCQEAYTAIKNAYPNVKIGVPLYAILGNYDWNTNVLGTQNYYDAIILHTYNTVSGVDGKTQEQMMQYLYAYTEYQKKAVAKFKALAPTKEVWVSEYGTLIQRLFKETDLDERSRMQFAKSTGVALTNMEMLLNMLSDENVDMAAYHFPNDSQGFGIIQSDTKLSNYYTFKEVSTILASCDSSYDITPIQCDKLSAVGSYINDVSSGNNCSTYKIGAWGFGTASGMNYVVLSNRTPDTAIVSLSGQSLKPVWSYGGTENILGDYLTNDLGFRAAGVIEQPEILNEAYANEVTMDGYSVVVCEVESDSGYISVSCNARTDGGEWDFNEDGGLKLTFGGAVTPSSQNVTLTANGTAVGCSFANIEGNMYSVLPQGGFLYDTDYVLTALGRSFAFTTCPKPFYENYTRDFYDAFSGSLASWTYKSKYFRVSGQKLEKYNTGYYWCDVTDRKYEDFVMTFDAVIPSTEHMAVRFRGGYIRIYSDGHMNSYDFTGTGVLLGQLAVPSNRSMSFKIVAVGGEIKIYAKASADAYYTYVGVIRYSDGLEHNIGFGGNGTYTVDNVEVKTNQTMFANVSCYQNVSGDDVSLSGLTGGTNLVEVELSGDAPAGSKLFGALYGANGKMLQMISPDGTGNNYLFEVPVSGAETEFKLFVWDGLDQMTPLEIPYVMEISE